jgi:hypothetical protein
LQAQTTTNYNAEEPKQHIDITFLLFVVLGFWELGTTMSSTLSGSNSKFWYNQYSPDNFVPCRTNISDLWCKIIILAKINYTSFQFTFIVVAGSPEKRPFSFKRASFM